MKGNKGFTLIELLAVIALIALLSLVIVPSIMNVVNKNKPKLSSATKKLIFEATEMYLDANQTDYIKGRGAVYCPTVQELIDNGFLDEKLINLETGEQYDTSLVIKSSYSGFKYDYEILNNSGACTVVFPDTSSAYIVIGELSYDRNGESKTKIYSNVETNITVPISTNKIPDNTQLELKIRRGKNYIGFTSSGGNVSSNSAIFTVTVPGSAAVGEYVIEVTDGKADRATKNFKIYINPIILFMGD